MFVLKRNQIIITALIVMIGVAGYLNYIDSRSPTPAGEAISLNDQGEINALVPNTDTSYEIGSALIYEDDNPAIANAQNPDSLTGSESTSSATENSANHITAENSSSEEDPGAAVFVNTSSDSSYFVQAKLNREQARAKEKSLLLEMINNTNLNEEKKAEAATSMMDIQTRIEKETAAEAMIEAKGFSEVYVRIDDNSVDVVVNKEVLTDAEIAQIEDIVKRKTGMNAEQIHISPMRK